MRRREQFEAVENGLGTRWRDREDRPFPSKVPASVFGRAVEPAVNVEEARDGVPAIRRTLERVEHGLLTFSRDGEDRAVSCATARGRAVKQVFDEQKLGLWGVAVPLATETMKHALRAGGRDCKDRSRVLLHRHPGSCRKAFRGRPPGPRWTWRRLRDCRGRREARFQRLKA